jgi:hypothetical protein
MRALYLGMMIGALASAGMGQTTIDAAHPYAYGANVGWIQARGNVTHGAVVGRFYCTGLMWSANCGWIDLGRKPLNGWQYGNTESNDWGVNHDGAGGLSGFAYGANVGWVAFEEPHGRPRVDLRTGVLSGYAYGANIGWISLSNVQAYVRTTFLEPGPDQDNDGLADAYEKKYGTGLKPLSGLNGHDADGDGVSDLAEAAADSNPLNSNDFLRVVSFAVSGSTNRVAWTVRPTRHYRLETTNALAGSGSWADAGAGLMTPPNASVMTQEVTGVTAGPRFYRVKAVVPLSP